jgi:choline dehydrogenase
LRELEREPGLRISVSLARPGSRGSIRAASPDPFAPPAIRLNYLSDPNDIRVITSGIAIARRILAAPALQPFVVRESSPGPEIASDESIERHIRANGSTVHHLVGTCRMGDDPGAVVDSRLRVRGLSALRGRPLAPTGRSEDEPE